MSQIKWPQIEMLELQDYNACPKPSICECVVLWLDHKRPQTNHQHNRRLGLDQGVRTGQIYVSE